MEYITTASDAKAHAKAHMTGIWAAALMPFTDDLRIDEDGFRENIRHWTRDLGIEGLFISGKQGEFFSMTVDERKRTLRARRRGDRRRRPDDHVVLRPEHGRRRSTSPATPSRSAPTTSSCTPRPCHFSTAQDETLVRLLPHDLRAASTSASHSGATPTAATSCRHELCNRLADLDNVVAIKYSVPRPMYAELTELAVRPHPGQHRVRGRVARQHHRARLDAVPVLVAAVPAADGDGSTDARLHPGGVRRATRRGPRDQPEPRSGPRRAPRHPTRRRSRTPIRSTGRSCSARSAVGSAPRCSN